MYVGPIMKNDTTPATAAITQNITIGIGSLNSANYGASIEANLAKTLNSPNVVDE